MINVGEALEYCTAELERSRVFFGHGADSAWDEAVQLVLTVVDLPLSADERVLSHPVSRQQRDRLNALLTQRIDQRIPMAYLLGRAWFAGLELRCDERAIIPRSPIGELIVEGFAPWYSGPAVASVLDLCCGGGAIGLATAHHFPEARVDLVDLDPRALELARENVGLLDLSGRVELIQSDLFSLLADRRYDLILSNPPYVDASDLASMPEEYHHEPVLALASGIDGLDITRRVLAQAADYLLPRGLLIVEVGNSWKALEQAFPRVPFTWIDLEQGGHGVFALSAKELHDYGPSFAQ